MAINEAYLAPLLKASRTNCNVFERTPYIRDQFSSLRDASMSFLYHNKGAIGKNRKGPCIGSASVGNNIVIVLTLLHSSTCGVLSQVLGTARPAAASQINFIFAESRCVTHKCNHTR